MMGSGKSTIGRLLGDATGWPYVDNDKLLRRATGMTARQLLASGGEARLRAAESDALELGLELRPPVIVGVAAGTILDATNRERMRDAVVVWLRASAAVLVERAEAVHRPFVDRDAGAWLDETARVREPLYEAVADLVVDTGVRALDAAVATIRAHLASVPACVPDPPR